MQKMVRLVNDRLSDAGALAIVLAGTVILVDVLFRIFFNAPFQGTADVVGLALLSVTFLQLPKIVADGKLLRLTVFYVHLPSFYRRLIDIAAHLIGAIVFVTLAVIAYEPTLQAYASREFFGTDAFRIRAWPIRALIMALWLCAAAAFLACAVWGTSDSQHDISGTK